MRRTGSTKAQSRSDYHCKLSHSFLLFCLFRHSLLSLFLIPFSFFSPLYSRAKAFIKAASRSPLRPMLPKIIYIVFDHATNETMARMLHSPVVRKYDRITQALGLCFFILQYQFITINLGTITEMTRDIFLCHLICPLMAHPPTIIMIGLHLFFPLCYDSTSLSHARQI